MATSYTTRNKTNRLAQIVTFLTVNPLGMTQAEIARRLGVMGCQKTKEK